MLVQAPNVRTRAQVQARNENMEDSNTEDVAIQENQQARIEEVIEEIPVTKKTTTSETKPTNSNKKPQAETVRECYLLIITESLEKKGNH